METHNLGDPPKKRFDLQYEIIKKLKVNPVVSAALKQVGVSRATYYRWLKANKYFAKIVEAARGLSISNINDLCEAQLILMVREKNLPAIRYWLDNHSNDYVKPHDRAFPGVPREVLTLDEDIFLVEEDFEELLEAMAKAEDGDEKNF